MANRASNHSFFWPGRRQHDAAHDRIAAFLTMDIQRSLDSADALVQQLDVLADDREATWERVGNSFHVKASGAGVTIEDTVDADALDTATSAISFEEFRQAAIAWADELRACSS